MKDNLTDSAILRDLGRRLEGERLRQNLKQSDLAKLTGISTKTIYNVEEGRGGSMRTLIALLRGLNQLDALDAVVPDPGLSPIQLSDLRGKQRQRASTPRGASNDLPKVAEEPASWRWGDEAQADSQNSPE